MPHDYTPDALIMLISELYTGKYSWVTWILSVLFLILGWISAFKTIDKKVLPFLGVCGRWVCGIFEGKFGDLLAFLFLFILKMSPWLYSVSGIVLSTQVGGYYKSGEINKLWEVDLSASPSVLSSPPSVLVIIWTLLSLYAIINFGDELLAAFFVYLFTFIGALSVGAKIYWDSPPGALPMSLWNVSLYAASGLVLIVYADYREYISSPF